MNKHIIILTNILLLMQISLLILLVEINVILLNLLKLRQDYNKMFSLSKN
jgi:hypothetical protein